MKTFLPLLFLTVFFVKETSAQCQIQNGDFEDWTDYTDSFEHELSLELLYPVVLPTDWFSVTRLLEIALSGFIVDYFDKDTLDIPIFEGLKQYSPGANGTASAARISGDTLLPVTDLIQFIKCNGRPEKMTGYFKYEGESQDTLIISAVLFKGDELIDTTNAIGYAVFTIAGPPIDISRNAAEYTSFSADFIYNSDEVPDTAAIQIISSKDESNPSDTSFHVVDEIQFEGGVVATRDFYKEAPFALTPNPTVNELHFNMNISSSAEIELFDALGSSVLRKVVEHSDAISISHLPVGSYIGRIMTNAEIYWQKILISR